MRSNLVDFFGALLIIDALTGLGGAVLVNSSDIDSGAFGVGVMLSGGALLGAIVLLIGASIAWARG